MFYKDYGTHGLVSVSKKKSRWVAKAVLAAVALAGLAALIYFIS